MSLQLTEKGKRYLLQRMLESPEVRREVERMERIVVDLPTSKEELMGACFNALDTERAREQHREMEIECFERPSYYTTG